MSGSVGKVAAERNQKALIELVAQPGNGTSSKILISSSIYNIDINMLIHIPSFDRRMRGL